VGEIEKGIVPVGSRMLVPSQPGYQGTSFAFDPSESITLLKNLGFKKASDGYFQPNYGPQKGKDLTFTIQSTSGNSIRSQTEVLFQAQMKAIGIKINVQNYDADTFGNNLPSGSYQIAEFAWVDTPFVSANQPTYCSYTNANLCGFNWTHSANAQVDSLMSDGSAASSTATEISDYNKADAVLWHNMVTLPLYQVPQFYDWSNNLRGVLPNPSDVGVTWNAEDWSIGS
jgi:peptide/nickel transport system substrate-binding protein